MSPSLPARGFLALIQVYKWTLSPLIGRDCRYLPTCSSYAADAIRAHGAWAGSWMGFARLCRCHPFGGHGWDPAPTELRTDSWWRPWRYGDWKGGYRAPPEDEPSATPVLPREGEVARAPARDGGVSVKISESSATPSVTPARDSSPHRGSTGF
jgi:hypothetical protein